MFISESALSIDISRILSQGIVYKAKEARHIRIVDIRRCGMSQPMRQLSIQVTIGNSKPFRVTVRSSHQIYNHILK